MSLLNIYTGASCIRRYVMEGPSRVSIFRQKKTIPRKAELNGIGRNSVGISGFVGPLFCWNFVPFRLRR